MRGYVAALLWVALSSPLAAQDQPPPPPEGTLEFKFSNADLRAVLTYISRETGLIFINQAKIEGSVDAIAARPIPRSKALDFLNTLLDPKGVVGIVNAYNPKVIELVTKDEARRRNIPVRVGADPAKIGEGDRVIIQVIPLRTLQVNAFDRELKGMLPKTADIAKDSANNALILTDTGENIKRFLRLLSKLEVMKYEPLKFKVFQLKNAEASDVARVIDQFVKKDQRGGQGSFSWEKAWFGDAPDRLGKPLSPTSEIVKAIPEPRGNFLVLVATQENLKLLETLVEQIDQRTAAIAQVKVYTLRNTQAQDLSTTITQLFRGESRSTQDRQPRQLQWWDAKATADVVGAHPIKALADKRSNALMVTATPEQLKLIDRIVASFDQVLSTKMYQLRFADAKETAGFVRELMKGSVPQVKAISESRTNTVVVTATDEQLAVLDELISEVDRQIQDSLTIKIFPIKNAEAADVAATIGQVLKPRRSGQGGVSIRPVETHVIKATNSIVVRGPDEYFKLIEEVIAHHESTPREERVTFVVKLRNAGAGSVAAILKAASGSGSIDVGSGFGPAMPALPSRERSGTRSEGGTEPYEPPIPGRSRNLGSQDPQPPSGRREVPSDLEVQAEDGSNMLIVSTSRRNVEAIKKVIAQLDRYRPQVLIRVLIAEVTLDDDLQYGVEMFLENKVRLPGGKVGIHSAATTFGLPPSGFAYLLSASDFEATFKAFADEGKLSVMATPRVLALDNQQATLSTGKRVPFITNSRQTPEGSVINTVQYQEVGIILKVTPRITAEGLVTMYVRPEVSDTTSATESVPIAPGVNAPTFSNNYVETTVTVKDGQTVVLGGLIRDFEDEVVTKVPILGDIPILGELFSKTVKSKKKRELMVFITPQVVFSGGELDELTAIERARLKLIDQRQITSEVKQWLSDAR